MEVRPRGEQPPPACPAAGAAPRSAPGLQAEAVAAPGGSSPPAQVTTGSCRHRPRPCPAPPRRAAPGMRGCPAAPGAAPAPRPAAPAPRAARCCRRGAQVTGTTPPQGGPGLRPGRGGVGGGRGAPGEGSEGSSRVGPAGAAGSSRTGPALGPPPAGSARLAVGRPRRAVPAPGVRAGGGWARPVAPSGLCRGLRDAQAVGSRWWVAGDAVAPGCQPGRLHPLGVPIDVHPSVSTPWCWLRVPPAVYRGGLLASSGNPAVSWHRCLLWAHGSGHLPAWVGARLGGCGCLGAGQHSMTPSCRVHGIRPVRATFSHLLACVTGWMSASRRNRFRNGRCQCVTRSLGVGGVGWPLGAWGEAR